MPTDYSSRLNSAVIDKGTAALVGLDPRWAQLPTEMKSRFEDTLHGRARAFEAFCCELIDIVAPLVPAVKPQIAFFEQLGPAGIQAAANVIKYARSVGLLVIADAKRGDIGSTAEAYADAWLAGEDPDCAAFAADALTVNAYLGADTLEPFVETAKKRGAGIYVLVRTSNPGAAVFQDRVQDSTKLFESVADQVQALNDEHFSGNDYGGIGAVVGATWPEELNQLRIRMNKVPLLIPGYGSQGGTSADVAAAVDEQGLGGLINSSRGINFAYLKEPYAAEFGDTNWRDAVLAATKDMIEDLGQHMSF